MPYKDRKKKSGINRSRRRIIRKWLTECKSSLGYSECGETFARCLGFHRTKRKDNEYHPIGRMPQDGYSKKRILEEIQKCIILCSNCHRKQQASFKEREVA